MEAYDGIPENAALIHHAGACVVIHSDDENGIQRLNQDAAKAQAAGRRMGIDIPDAQVIEWFTLNAAKAMGIAEQTGSLEPARWPTWCCGTAIRCRSTPPRESVDRRRAAVRRARSGAAAGERLRARPAGEGDVK
jgi:hypothetical protein